MLLQDNMKAIWSIFTGVLITTILVTGLITRFTFGEIEFALHDSYFILESWQFIPIAFLYLSWIVFIIYGIFQKFRNLSLTLTNLILNTLIGGLTVFWLYFFYLALTITVFIDLFKSNNSNLKSKYITLNNIEGLSIALVLLVIILEVFLIIKFRKQIKNRKKLAST